MISSHARTAWWPSLLAWFLLLALWVPFLLSPRVFVAHPIHDIYVPLDMGWRWVQGQWPHRDFPSVIGLLYYIIYGSAVAIVGTNPNALIVASVIGGSIAALLAQGIGRQRLGPIGTGLLVFACGVIVSTPRILDDVFVMSGFLALYNRLGWVLLGLVLIESIADRPASFGYVLMIAALIVGLFLLKLNIALAATLALALSWLRNPVARQAVPIAVGACFLYSLTPIGIAYWRDIYSVLLAAQTEARLWRIEKLFLADWRLEGFVALALLAAYWTSRSRWIITIYTGGALLLCLGVAVQNNQDSVPAFAFICVGLWAYTRNRSMALIACGALIWASTADTLGLINEDIVDRTMATQAPSIPGGIGISAPPHWATLDNLAPIRTGHLSADAFLAAGYKVNDGDYLEILADGRRLLSRSPHPGTIMTFALSNPFPFLLHQPSPKGVPPFFDFNRSFSVKSHPDPTKMFADVDWVMVPKLMYTPSITDGMMLVYGPTLGALYRVAGTSLYWTLYQRRAVLR